ncbi:hypothetical protein OCJ37_19540 [Xanthomonas sp. AM6]|uniref:hypothetical protein n=1 Tax=Xanthomonas sp. AM6 TaxID=2982531 RepID=UPI0021D89A3A|nr:hypothetical protein [Xanthomonas sp. AM6]UYB52131.1 hypothetical protein OCJ37_19540 [Xanthomonas sp. AM6]
MRPLHWPFSWKPTLPIRRSGRQAARHRIEGCTIARTPYGNCLAIAAGAEVAGRGFGQLLDLRVLIGVGSALAMTTPVMAGLLAGHARGQRLVPGCLRVALPGHGAAPRMAAPSAMWQRPTWPCRADAVTLAAVGFTLI